MMATRKPGAVRSVNQQIDALLKRKKNPPRKTAARSVTLVVAKNPRQAKPLPWRVVDTKNGAVVMTADTKKSAVFIGQKLADMHQRPFKVESNK